MPVKFKDKTRRANVQAYNKANRKFADPVKRAKVQAANKKKRSARKAAGKKVQPKMTAQKKAAAQKRTVTRSSGQSTTGRPKTNVSVKKGGGLGKGPSRQLQPVAPPKRKGGKTTAPRGGPFKGDRKTTGKTIYGGERFPDRAEYKPGEVRRYEPSTGKLSSNVPGSRAPKKKAPAKRTGGAKRTAPKTGRGSAYRPRGR